MTWGAGEAQLHGVEVVVFTALDTMPQVPAAQQPGVDNSEGLLASLAKTVQKITADYPAVFQHSKGSAAQQLIAACQGEDILVVGSRGRNPFTVLLLGSVSRACLKSAPCPVVVVRERAEPTRTIGRVIVGVDGSEHSRRALWWLHTRPRSGVRRCMRCTPCTGIISVPSWSPLQPDS